MTASEQHTEYAAAHTPTIGAKVRAAIEADVLRRVADRYDGGCRPVDGSYRAGEYGGEYAADLRAEADRIEEGAR